MNRLRTIYNDITRSWFELCQNLTVLHPSKYLEESPTYEDLDTRSSTEHEAMAAYLEEPVDTPATSRFTQTPLVLASSNSPTSIQALARKQQRQQRLPICQSSEARAESKYKTRPEGYWDKEPTRKPSEWLQKQPLRRPPPQPARLEPPRSLSKTVTSKILPFLMDEWSHPAIKAEYAARKDRQAERASYRHWQRLRSMYLNAYRRTAKDNEEAVFEEVKKDTVKEEVKDTVEEELPKKRRGSSSFSDSSLDSD